MSTTEQARTQQVMPEPTTRVRVSDQDELDVWVMGEGVPVVFVHGAMTRDLLKPTMDELVTRGAYQVIHYGRRGHGGRGLPGEAADIGGQAPDIVAVLDALGIGKAHVAGHSFGGYIALELAAQAPDRLLSTLLFEPLFAARLRTLPALELMQESAEVLPRVVQTYLGGDSDGAVTMLWDFTSGLAGAAELLEPALPESARELAATDLNTFVQIELPAMGAWDVDPATVQRIATPVGWIGGADSPPAFTESCALLQGWLPTTNVVTIDGAGHYFPALKPAETAAAIDMLLVAVRRGGIGRRPG